MTESGLKRDSKWLRQEKNYSQFGSELPMKDSDYTNTVLDEAILYFGFSETSYEFHDVLCSSGIIPWMWMLVCQFGSKCTSLYWVVGWWMDISNRCWILGRCMGRAQEQPSKYYYCDKYVVTEECDNSSCDFKMSNREKYEVSRSQTCRTGHILWRWFHSSNLLDLPSLEPPPHHHCGQTQQLLKEWWVEISYGEGWWTRKLIATITALLLGQEQDRNQEDIYHSWGGELSSSVCVHDWTYFRCVRAQMTGDFVSWLYRLNAENPFDRRADRSGYEAICCGCW